MKAIAWFLFVCLVGISTESCTKKEASEESAAQGEPTEVAEVAGGADIVGGWQLSEWKAGDADQFEMWRVQKANVEFRADGSLETRLVSTDGEERTSSGTWKRSGNTLDVVVQGGGEEGDEPFERARQFAIDELTADALSIHSEIGTGDKAFVLIYKARRLPAQ